MGKTKKTGDLVNVVVTDSSEKNGKGILIFRLILLTLVGIVFVPYCKIFK